MKFYRLEKWENGRLIAAFEEESDMNFKKWQYFHAMEKLGRWRGQEMKLYINGEREFVSTDKRR
jgi:hypothetical protein